MFAFIDTAPAEQLEWGRQALAVVEASTQPAAKRWEASIRNNIGYALHQLGRYEEALQQFRLALALRERGTDAEATRTAHWMIAWTLRAMERPRRRCRSSCELEREADAAGRPDPVCLGRARGALPGRRRYRPRPAYRQRREALSQKSPGG